ncbi:MAG: AbrB/MazE/SpoVT family DNA-binding domain-containing protein [Gemmatimonadota bacterium]
MTVSVKMSSKHQIVVPKEARDALELVPGDRLLVTVRGRMIEMEKQPPDLQDRLDGALRGLSPDGGLWVELGDE